MKLKFDKPKKLRLGYSKKSKSPFRLNPFGKIGLSLGKHHIFSFRKMRVFLDSDRDSIMDALDCRPLDPKRQHIRPSKTMKKRLKKLPIYLTSGEAIEPEEARVYYTLEGEKVTRKGKEKVKKLPKDVAKTRTRILSAIKKRPEVVGEIERQEPGVVIVTARGGEKDVIASGGKRKKGEFIAGYAGRTERPIGEKGKRKQHFIVIRTQVSRGTPYRGTAPEEVGSTAIHELEHVRQFKEQEKKPGSQEKMHRGKYRERKEEKLAREAERKAESKHTRLTYGARKYFTEQLTRITDPENVVGYLDNNKKKKKFE